MKIVMSRQEYVNVKHIVSQYFKEISCFGVAVPCDGGLEIKKLYMDKNVKRSSAETEIDPQDAAKMLYLAHKDGFKEYVLVWLHSHPRMGAFWSGTDEIAIHQLSANGSVLAIVFNDKLEYKARFRCKSNGAYPAVDIDNLVIDIQDYCPVGTEWQECLEYFRAEDASSERAIGHYGKQTFNYGRPLANKTFAQRDDSDYCKLTKSDKSLLRELYIYTLDARPTANYNIANFYSDYIIDQTDFQAQVDLMRRDQKENVSVKQPETYKHTILGDKQVNYFNKWGGYDEI